MYRFLLFLLFVMSLVAFAIWGTHSYFFAKQGPLLNYGDEVDKENFQDRVAVVFASSITDPIEEFIYLLNIVKAYHDKQISKIVISGEWQETKENRLLSIMDYFIANAVLEADLYPDFHSPEPYHTCRRLHEVFSIPKVIFFSDRFRAQQALFVCNYLGKIDAIAWVWPADENLSGIFSAFTDELSVLADIYLTKPDIYLKDRSIDIFTNLYSN